MSSLIDKKNSKATDEIDLGRLIGELIDHRKLIIAVTSIFTLLAVFYVLFSTPIYQADALIQVEQKQGNAILSNLSQILPDSQPESAPEIALLQSRMILGKTVDDLNLQAIIEQDYFPILGKGWSRLTGQQPGELSVSRLYIPSKNGEIGQIKLKVINNNNYTITYGEKVLKGKVGQLLTDGKFTILVDNIIANEGVSFTIQYQSPLKAIIDLQKNLVITDQGKDTGILNLVLTGEDPALIKKILDSISDNYLLQNISRQAAQDAKSLEFLNNQLPTVRSDLDVAENKLNQYRQKKDSVDLTLEAKSALDQIVNVDNQLNELTFRESEISQLYTKEHPTYKALLEKRITLESEKNKLSKRISSMPETQQEVLRLSRDVDSGKIVYMQLLNRQQELNIAKSSAIGNVRIIDNAVTAPKPIKPKKLLVVLAGLFMGGAISIGLVLIKVFLRRGIESPEQIEELGLNVYASVPVSEELEKKNKQKVRKGKSKDSETTFLALESPADIAIEAIRGLRTSLHFAMMESKNNVLMITGATPDVGKTFTSSNLAAIITQTGKKVLFIDTDMRRGYVHKVFKANNDKGLSELLSGKTKVSETIQTIPEAGFDFISRGMSPPNPAELLMHSRFGELIEWANDNYDLVIIDTPPILSVTDAAVIGRYAGTTLLVARFELNTTKEIEVSLKRFEQSGVLIRGCILNGMMKKASTYMGYGYHHYGYKYTDK